ncbi:flagellar hook-associated protein FlgL [Kushneria aurantia]|uniref:Flagellar hook-associated protein FlgL n=1 Tax=Kushneria aurantia TaxID=504092 RepID=A0ABV6G0Z4_9GAMM|nr:flagellar hook-associated protein FlgL [Kushneria aurantia]
MSMRISTSMMFERSLNSMQSRQGDLARTGEQIASGNRIVSPSDDPRAASQALIVKQDQAIQSQFESSRTSATSALQAQENALQGVTDLLNQAKGKIVQASNGTLSDNDRMSVASDLEGIYNGILGLANGTDSNGNYIFSGSQGDTQPFVETDSEGTPGVGNYQGDNRALNMQVDASRSMNVNSSGAQVFGEGDSSILNNLANAIETLRTPSDQITSEERQQALGAANSQIDSGSERVLNARTDLGTKLNELDVLGGLGTTRTINNSERISDLEDLDYAEAISRYTLNQIGLEASQKVFTRTQQNSLFDLL